jgi:hypothetical protein
MSILIEIITLAFNSFLPVAESHGTLRMMRCKGLQGEKTHVASQWNGVVFGSKKKGEQGVSR